MPFACIVFLIWSRAHCILVCASIRISHLQEIRMLAGMLVACVISVLRVYCAFSCEGCRGIPFNRLFATLTSSGSQIAPGITIFMSTGAIGISVMAKTLPRSPSLLDNAIKTFQVGEEAPLHGPLSGCTFYRNTGRSSSYSPDSLSCKPAGDVSPFKIPHGINYWKRKRTQKTRSLQVVDGYYLDYPLKIHLPNM